MARPMKPKAPEKPEPPSETFETWKKVWSFDFPSDYFKMIQGQTPQPTEGFWGLEEFRQMIPDEILHEVGGENLRVKWRASVQWEHADCGIELQQQEISANPKYEAQVVEHEKAMEKWAEEMALYTERLERWETLNEAYEAYEKTGADS